MESTEEVENEDDFTDKRKDASILESIKKRSFSYCEAPRLPPSAPRRISIGPLQQPPPVPARRLSIKLRPRAASADGNLDFDAMPKTGKLNNKIASTRPKVPYKPPSRNHLQNRTDDDRQEDDFYTIPWKKELRKKKDSGVLPSRPSVKPSEPPSTIIEMDEPEPSVSTTIPVSIEDFQDVVMQLKNELGLLKTEMDSLKVLTEVVDALKSDYETDIKILRQDLDEERTKVTDLRIELELLRGKAKGLQ